MAPATQAWPDLAAAIAAAIGCRLQPEPSRSVHGGCIAQSLRWETDSQPIFVKIAGSEERSMLEAEAAGLEELERAHAVRVPRVLATGSCASQAYLALEWIDFGRSTPSAAQKLGEQLARQHKVSASSFGWSRDNTIGSTPQLNTQAASWVEFFREHRLRYQLELGRRNGHGGALFDRGMLLLESMDGLFEGHRPVPSLLHGDLWGGNWSADLQGQPVIFDPAVYYGDREADIAMTHLFGGFEDGFHAAYEAAWPLDPGSANRRPLYNLYHVLNHFNLFGGGYGGQALGMINRLLAELAH
jgi:protein-ribulosamine 3-kinase